MFSLILQRQSSPCVIPNLQLSYCSSCCCFVSFLYSSGVTSSTKAALGSFLVLSLFLMLWTAREEWVNAIMGSKAGNGSQRSRFGWPSIRIGSILHQWNFTCVCLSLATTTPMYSWPYHHEVYPVLTTLAMRVTLKLWAPVRAFSMGWKWLQALDPTHYSIFRLLYV